MARDNKAAAEIALRAIQRGQCKYIYIYIRAASLSRKIPRCNLAPGESQFATGGINAAITSLKHGLINPAVFTTRIRRFLTARRPRLYDAAEVRAAPRRC